MSGTSSGSDSEQQNREQSQGEDREQQGEKLGEKRDKADNVESNNGEASQEENPSQEGSAFSGTGGAGAVAVAGAVSSSSVSPSSRALILSRLSGLPVSDEDAASEEAKELAIAVKECCTTAESLTDMLDEVHDCALSSECACTGASHLFRSLSQLEVDGLKCRNAFLKRIQADFEARAELRQRSRDHYLNLITLLCQVFRRVRVADGTTMLALCTPILEGFSELLAEPSDDGLMVLAKQLQVIGPELQRLQSSKVSDLLCSLRNCIVTLGSSSGDDQKVSKETMAALLLTLELYHATPKPSWISKDKTLNDFYDKILPPGTRMTPMEVPLQQEESNQQMNRNGDANVNSLANQLIGLNTGNNGGAPMGAPGSMGIIPDLSRPPPGYVHFPQQPPTQPPNVGSAGVGKSFHDLPPFTAGTRGTSGSRGQRGGAGGGMPGAANNHWEGSSNHSSSSWNSSSRDNGGRPPRGIHGQQASNGTPVGRLRRPLHAAANNGSQWQSNGMGGGNRHGGSNGVGSNQWNSTEPNNSFGNGGGSMGNNMMGGRRDYGAMGNERGGGNSSWGGPGSGGGAGDQSTGGGVSSWAQPSEDRGPPRRGGGFGSGGVRSGHQGDSSTDWGTFDATAMRGGGGGSSSNKSWGGGNNDPSSGGQPGGGWGEGSTVMSPKREEGATWGTAPSTGVQWGAKADAELPSPAPAVVAAGWGGAGPAVSSPPSGRAAGGNGGWGGPIDDVPSVPPVAAGNGWGADAMAGPPKPMVANTWNDAPNVMGMEQQLAGQPQQQQPPHLSALAVAEAEATAAVANASSWSTADNNDSPANASGWGEVPGAATGWGGGGGGIGSASAGKSWGKPAGDPEPTGWGDPDPPRQMTGDGGTSWWSNSPASRADPQQQQQVLTIPNTITSNPSVSVVGALTVAYPPPANSAEAPAVNMAPASILLASASAAPPSFGVAEYVVGQTSWAYPTVIAVPAATVVSPSNDPAVASIEYVGGSGASVENNGVELTAFQRSFLQANKTYQELAAPAVELRPANKHNEPPS